MEDESANPETRRAFVEVLGEIREPASVPVLLRVATGNSPVILRKATMTALANFDDAAIGEKINEVYGSLPSEVRASTQRLLSSRESWTRLWVRNLSENPHWAREVPMPMVFQLTRLEDPALREQMDRLWPSSETPNEARAEAEMDRWSQALRGGPGNPYQGKARYQAACALCHTLFDEGGTIGPDLTSYQRSDLAALMLAIVNPNAEIREGYENMVADTTDGRSLSGFIVEENPRLVVLRGMDGQNVALERKALARLQRAELSLMPEGLLEGWEDQQVRDLFAYLRNSQPLP